MCRAPRTLLRTVRWRGCRILACLGSGAGVRIRVPRVGGSLSVSTTQGAGRLLAGPPIVPLVVVCAPTARLALARGPVRAHGEPGGRRRPELLRPHPDLSRRRPWGSRGGGAIATPGCVGGGWQGGVSGWRDLPRGDAEQGAGSGGSGAVLAYCLEGRASVG